MISKVAPLAGAWIENSIMTENTYVDDKVAVVRIFTNGTAPNILTHIPRIILKVCDSFFFRVSSQAWMW